MITKEEAIRLAQAHLLELQKKCAVDIRINYALSAEYSVGYVFFYNTTKFWETQDVAYSLVGNGPILVNKDTGAICDLPANQSVEASIGGNLESQN